LGTIFYFPERNQRIGERSRNKLAAGFTASASWNGDKHNTLYQLPTLALQHGMVWVGLGLPPGYNHSKGSAEDLNRLGASVGAMARVSPPATSAP